MSAPTRPCVKQGLPGVECVPINMKYGPNHLGLWFKSGTTPCLRARPSVSAREPLPFLALHLPFCQRLMPLLAVLQRECPRDAAFPRSSAADRPMTDMPLLTAASKAQTGRGAAVRPKSLPVPLPCAVPLPLFSKTLPLPAAPLLKRQKSLPLPVVPLQFVYRHRLSVATCPGGRGGVRFGPTRRGR